LYIAAAVLPAVLLPAGVGCQVENLSREAADNGLDIAAASINCLDYG
jgi:hypothetical protein